MRGRALVGAVFGAALLTLPAFGASSVPTTRVSVATGGGQANGNSIAPAISKDGRYVASTRTPRTERCSGILTLPPLRVLDRQFVDSDQHFVISLGRILLFVFAACVHPHRPKFFRMVERPSHLAS